MKHIKQFNESSRTPLIWAYEEIDSEFKRINGLEYVDYMRLSNSFDLSNKEFEKIMDTFSPIVPSLVNNNNGLYIELFFDLDSFIIHKYEDEYYLVRIGSTSYEHGRREKHRHRPGDYIAHFKLDQFDEVLKFTRLLSEILKWEGNLYNLLKYIN
jgi:hypothetical protein